MKVDHASIKPDVFKGQRRIVVLAPHPDDESLGCGALLAQAFAGAGAHVISLTDGSASHPASREWTPERIAALRREELNQAVAHLGGAAADVTWVGAKDSRLHEADACALATILGEIIAAIEAECVFAPTLGDHHADHKATAEIAQHIQMLCPDLDFYSYPIWSRWDDADFAQTVRHREPHFVETAAWQDIKRSAVTAHKSQMGQVVEDDPNGFVLDPEFIEKFVTEDEVFWRMA